MLETHQRFSLEFIQAFKFFSLGVFGYLLYSGLCILSLHVGLSEVLAILFSFAGVTSFNFFLLKKIFQPDYLNSQNMSRTLSRFIPAALLNLLLVLLCNNLISRIFIAGLGSVLAAPLIPAFINFFVMKYLVFRVK
jgi:hypothetical protein